MGYLILVAVFAMCLFYLAAHYEANQLHIKKYTMINKKISSKKIVFFSDVHFGKWYHSRHLLPLVLKINALQPDIVIFGGDFIDHYQRDEKRLDIAWLISHLQEITCEHKYCVMGNHDSTVYEELMKKAGFHLLKNELANVENLNIIGLEDALHGYPSFDGIKIKDEDYTIVIVHEPDVVDEIEKDKIDLILSGHTHGGQVGIPFLKYKVLPDKGKRYLKGKYPLNATCTLIVSSGIGRTGLPLRLGNPPEIVVIEVQEEN